MAGKVRKWHISHVFEEPRARIDFPKHLPVGSAAKPLLLLDLFTSRTAKISVSLEAYQKNSGVRAPREAT